MLDLRDYDHWNLSVSLVCSVNVIFMNLWASVMQCVYKVVPGGRGYVWVTTAHLHIRIVTHLHTQTYALSDTEVPTLGCSTSAMSMLERL